MGLKTFGFGFGREDIWHPEIDTYWGAEKEWLAPSDNRYEDVDKPDTMENPLAAVQMGLIYVNPEGVNGQPDPMKTAAQVRETFARMAMDDEETAALTAADTPSARPTATATPARWAPSPKPPTSRPGLRLDQPEWAARPPTPSPRARRRVDDQSDQVRHGLFRAAVRLRVGTDQEPGRRQPVAADRHQGRDMPVDATDPSIRRMPIMTDADMAMKMDPTYARSARSSWPIRPTSGTPSPAPGSS
jgi:catalase-peroxidase